MPIQEPASVTVHDPQHTSHLLTLEFADRKDFDDPKFEYRRLFSELLGTFMLVAAGGGLLHGKGQISLAAAVVAPGLMVLAVIRFMERRLRRAPERRRVAGVRGAGDSPWKR